MKMAEERSDYVANSSDSEVSNITVRVPKRVLHFSDGVLEEYDDDDECDRKCVDNTQLAEIDPKTLSWGPWMNHYLKKSGSTTLGALDFVGENLAWFFGVTTPKYQAELEEYERIKAEKQQEMKAKEGWSEPSSSVIMKNLETKQPAPTSV